MNYKLAVPLSTAKHYLEDEGFEENAWGVEGKEISTEDNIIGAIKIIEEENIAIAVDINGNTETVEVDVYRYSGDKNAHNRIRGVRGYKKYLRDIKDIWQ